ncbi:MAG: adaptor protein MecA [Butyrivibrio sp.]|nr:adaptor protein MecA [Butyrivibrio sp.]
MIIVKMNNTTVECNIAASELREIGLTPEAIVNGETRSVPFMAQLNREVGEQLDYNPENEVLMMSKNMMSDGSVRIFAVKMNNDDIQNAADRIRGTANNILEAMTQDKVDAIKARSGKDKGIALNAMISGVSDMINKIYLQDDEDSENGNDDSKEMTSRPIMDYAKYMAEFETLDDCIRFCTVVRNLPVEDSALYRHNGYYYLSVGLRTTDDREVFSLRKTGLEYATSLVVNSPAEMHLEESGNCVIHDHAIEHLTEMNVKE